MFYLACSTLEIKRQNKAAVTRFSCFTSVLFHFYFSSISFVRVLLEDYSRHRQIANDVDRRCRAATMDGGAARWLCVIVATSVVFSTLVHTTNARKSRSSLSSCNIIQGLLRLHERY